MLFFFVCLLIFYLFPNSYINIGSSKPSLVFFDKWELDFKEEMDTSLDQTFAEVLEVQLSPDDIGDDERQNVTHTYMLQLILKEKAPELALEEKSITVHKRVTKTGKSVSLNVFLFCFECMVMFRNGVLSTSKMYVFLD